MSEEYSLQANPEMDLLFLSRIIPTDMVEEVSRKSRGGIEEAANALQKQLLLGLAEASGAPVRVLNVLPVGSFPRRYQGFWIRGAQIDRDPGLTGESLSYLNVSGVKQCLRPWLGRSRVRSWAKASGARPKVLVAYTPDLSFLGAVRQAKAVDRRIATCLLLPDVPQYLDLGDDTAPLLRLYKRALAKFTQARLNSFDGYVLLTRHMAELVGPSKPWMLLEGVATDSFQDINLNEDWRARTIFHAGTLHKQFGIPELLEAFHAIPDQSYRLVLCGVGDAVPQIADACRSDTRIQYLGRQPRLEVLRLMASSTIAVNPRRNVGDYVRYSFPSKTLECLSSGRPLVGYKLAGIPEEYDTHIAYVEDDSREALTRKMMEVCELPHEVSSRMGRDAREFALSHKGRVNQGKRFFTFLGALTAGDRLECA